MQVWLETVPILLQKLNIEHVSLITHSAGAIYTLNTLLHHSNSLDPKAPIVAFMGLCQHIYSSRRADQCISSICSLLGLSRNPSDVAV